jgi:hypothetical protein
MSNPIWFWLVQVRTVESYKVVPGKVSLSRTGLGRILNRRRREIPEHHQKTLVCGTMASRLLEFKGLGGTF